MKMLILKAGTSMSNKKMNKNSVSGTFSTKSSYGGFTFIEILVALAIVSISMLALLRLNILSINLADIAEKTTQAVMLANEKIEEIKAGDVIKPQSISGTSKRDNITLYWRSRVEQISALPISGTEVTGLKKISVDVSWKQGWGKKYVHFSTYQADREWK